MAMERRFISSTLLDSISKENTLLYKSTSTLEHYKKTCTLKPVKPSDGRHIVEEIVRNIFKEKTGHHDGSSSSCSSAGQYRPTVTDKRLRQWKHSLSDRQKLERKIRLKTGKRTNEMLFNRHATVDNRDKKTVQRLLDYAERMNPIKLRQKKADNLREYFDAEKCVCVPELHETLPKAELEGAAVVEISGLPLVTKYEIIGETAKQGKSYLKNKSKWLNSKALEHRIECSHKDIERVIEFYPDIDNLQLVGKRVTDELIIPQKPKIQCIGDIQLMNLSADSSEEDNTLVGIVSEPVVIKEEITKPDVAISINGIIFERDADTSSKSATWNVNFECEPFQRKSIEVLVLENVGSQLLTFSWQRINFYPKHSTVNSSKQCFLFNYKKFVLPPGCSRIITVMFQPRYTRVVKEKWHLRVFPKIFCEVNDIINLTLQGQCKVPKEYKHLTDKRQTMVVDKSNKRIMDKLARTHGSLVPLLQPHEVLCPYERIFDEREIFNAQNKGYKCERFDDLEQLKNLYKSLKKPREHDWDLKLESMKKLIWRQADAYQRKLAFAKLMEILSDLMGSHQDLMDKFEHTEERDCSRYIYVRGVIGNGIQEWEDLAILLVDNSVKLELQRLYASLEENSEESEEDEHMKPWLHRLKYDNPEAFVLRNLQASKHYQDSIFILTYTHLCDIVENIVSVIESTEYV